MKKKLLIVGGVLGLLLIINIINAYYPFRSVRPNYKDVETTFDRIKFPADWVQTDHSEDKGIAGRACPPEGSGCFHKSRTYNYGSSDLSSIQAVFKSSGCVSVSIFWITGKDVHPGEANLTCTINGLSVSGTIREAKKEVSVIVGT